MAINPQDFDRAMSQLPIGRDAASVRRRVEAMEILLERAFPLPGTSRRIGLDSIVGLVPVVGDVVDFVFRSNTRNLKIVKRHLDKHHPASRTIDG